MNTEKNIHKNESFWSGTSFMHVLQTFIKGTHIGDNKSPKSL